MEHNDHSRRQSQYNPYAGQQPSSEAPGQYATSASVERFRPAPFPQQSPTSASARAGNDGQPVYSFSQNLHYGAQPLPSNALQYASNLSQGPQRVQQQPQQYPQYGSSVVYGVPQQPQQAPPQSPYEQIQPFRQPPPSTATETLQTQFGVPQTHAYYLQHGPTSAPAADLPTQQYPSQYQHSAYPHAGPSQPQAYAGMTDPVQTAVYTTYGQQPQQYEAQPAPGPDQMFMTYQQQVRTVFSCARDGTLANTASLLLEISQYLLGNAETLGLTRDDDTQHHERIRLWDEFNRAWLVTLQRQDDLMREMQATGQGPREPQSLLSHQTLDQLSRELIRHCDAIEKHGLVDYQMGVAEEEITNLLLRCIRLYEDMEQRPDDASALSAADRQR